MIFALLLSLVLHGLLFLVRFAPPSWKDFASGTSPLSVILADAPAEVAQSSSIAEATQESTGTAKFGVQKDNPFAEQPLVAAQDAPVAEAKIDIPQDIVDREVLVVKKPSELNMADTVPELLVTKSTPHETQESKEKPFAPAPSVAKAVVVAAPPVEKLVGSEPVSGVKQEKIVFANPEQGNQLSEKPGVTSSGINPESIKPVTVVKPEPVKVEVVKPVMPKPVMPKPIQPEEAKPVEIEKPKPIIAEPPKLAKVEEPPAAKVEPQPIARPVEIKQEPPAPPAENKFRPIEAGKSDEFRPGLPALKIPSLADLSIASVRKFSSDEGRKIRFGERRKTIGVREQDFRYAMYAESVRLKLQRIGMLNFPAAAAKNNISGSLSVLISIRADGGLEDFRIIQPSGYEVLNKGAENIVRMCAPFSPLPDNIREETDILNIKINWSFSNSNLSFE